MFDSEQSLIVGVDGGGSGCRVALGTASDGILTTAQGARANFTSDPQGAVETLLNTVSEAADAIDMPLVALRRASAHLGLAGVMGPQDSAAVAAAMPFATTTVTDDRPTAVAGALGDQDGYLLSVGTGTIVAARTEGQFRSVGGWGFNLSDHGSGAWLGRAALERALLCQDGVSAHSDLTRTLMTGFEDDPAAVVAFSVSAKPGDYATFAPDIVSAARAGDTWGLKILQSGAEFLIDSLTALGFEPGDRLCLTGGVGPHYASFLPQDVLAGRRDARGSALDGAFQLAKAQGARR